MLHDNNIITEYRALCIRAVVVAWEKQHYILFIFTAIDYI